MAILDGTIQYDKNIPVGNTPRKYWPKYPVMIISKGRADTRHTARQLDHFGIPYFVAVEQHEVEAYKATHDHSPYATILTLPFSNHGKGSGVARNWIWNWAKERGYRRHWCLDDNIKNFWRLYNNSRLKMATGTFFRIWEDWNDRFLNMPLTGLQYKFFVMDSYHYKPVLLNTRLMSCILIENSLEHQWRGKYNEDVDLSLRTLKSGYCTALSYIFLCGKAQTGTVKGGNTTEIYNDYKDGGLSDYNKSKMLVDLHPDCVSLVKRYGRWHHHVDISRFEHNRPILDPNVTWAKEPNDYGLELTFDYDAETNTHGKSWPANKIIGCPREIDTVRLLD